MDFFDVYDIEDGSSSFTMEMNICKWVNNFEQENRFLTFHYWAKRVMI